MQIESVETNAGTPLVAADPMEPLPKIAILTSEFVDVRQLIVISLLNLTN